MQNLLLTRPEAHSRRFAADLDARFQGRLSITIAPLQAIRLLDFALPDPAPAGLVFTSEYGVAAYGAQNLPASRVWCVGSRTAQAARSSGHQVVAAWPTAEALLAEMTATGPMSPLAGPLVHMRGVHARGDIAARLSKDGMAVTEVICYDQRDQGLTVAAQELLARPHVVIVPLFSPRASVLLSAVTGRCMAKLVLVAHSEAVAAAWTGPLAFRIVIARRPTADAMMDALAAVIDPLPKP